MRGLKYISWQEPSGYGIAARRYLAALSGTDIPLTWTPMVPGTGWGQSFYYQPYEGQESGISELNPICNRAIDYDTVIVHLIPEYFPKWKAREPGKRLIGLTTWETDRLPPHWPGLLNLMDEIWVCSTWNRDVFRASGVTVPIRVVPYILPPPPNPSSGSGFPPQDLGIPEDHRVFYSINVWSQRKALDQLLTTYWSTFTADDPVTLILKTSQQDMTHRFRYASFPLKRLAGTRRTVRRLQRTFSDRPATVILADEHVPDPMIEALHTRGDVYVSLSHAEGWGLGAFDAVAAGNPVIMTRYGGALDFLDPEQAALVDCAIVPVEHERDTTFTGPAHHWADPDPDHAGQWMRRLFDDPADARQRGLRLQAYARQRFDATVVLPIMLRLLNATHEASA